MPGAEGAAAGVAEPCADDERLKVELAVFVPSSSVPDDALLLGGRVGVEALEAVPGAEGAAAGVAEPCAEEEREKVELAVLVPSSSVPDDALLLGGRVRVAALEAVPAGEPVRGEAEGVAERQGSAVRTVSVGDEVRDSTELWVVEGKRQRVALSVTVELAVALARSVRCVPLCVTEAEGVGDCACAARARRRAASSDKLWVEEEKVASARENVHAETR